MIDWVVGTIAAFSIGEENIMENDEPPLDCFR